MKTIEDLHKIVDDWNASGCVGNLVAFKGPRRTGVEVIIEETRKMHEVGPEITVATNELFAMMGSAKLEVVAGKDGTPDRIKIVRRIP